MNTWQNNLKNMFDEKEEKESEKKERTKDSEIQFAEFIIQTVRPAFEELSIQLKRHKRTTGIFDNNRNYASITVQKMSESGITEEEFQYVIRLPLDAEQAYPITETHIRDKKDGKTYVVQGSLRSGEQDYTTKDITKDDIIQHFLQQYEMYMNQ